MSKKKIKNSQVFDTDHKVQLAAETTKSELEFQQVPKSNSAGLQIERIILTRRAVDIGDWRAALRIAESPQRPNRQLLYNIYNDIELDAHLSSVMDRIIFRCTNNPIHYYVDGKIEEGDINDLTNTPFFYDLIKYIVQSRWWGHSLIQCNFMQTNFDITKRPGVEIVSRANVRPEYGDILPKPGDESNAIPFRKPPYSYFLLEVGSNTDLGLLNRVAPNVLYKRYGVKDWAEFLEAYGMPIPEMQYDPNIPGQREEAEKLLKDKGSNFGIAVPVGSSFTLHDSAKAGNSEAFGTHASFHNQEVSKAFLLQTMTTENGSSRSQAEVHLEAENEAIRAYRMLVEMTLNYKLKPMLAMHGMNADKGKFKYDDRANISKVGMADLLVKLQSIADIPMSWVYETFNIPPPTGADDIKDNPAARSQQPNLAPPEKKKLTLNLPEYVSSTTLQLTLEEGAITGQEEDLLEAVYLERLRTGQINPKYFNALFSQLTDGVNIGLGNPKADFDSPDHLMRTMLETNVQRFAGAKSLALVQQLNELKQTAKDFRDFQDQAMPLLGNYNVNWLRAEYNHAIAMSQSAANWQRNYADRDLYPYWEYVTAGDDRVRMQHESLDGRIFRYDDPEGARLYPPNDWGCRCDGIQRSDRGGKEVSTLQTAIDSMGQNYWSRMQQKGFDFNPGDSMKVFSKNQEYLAEFNVNTLTYKDFQQPAFASFKNLPNLALKSYKQYDTAKKRAEWWQSRSADNAEQLYLTDYRNRPIELERNTVDDLASKKQGWLIGLIETLLQYPDEVYLQENGNTYTRLLLKYYQGKAVVMGIRYGRNQSEIIAGISIATLVDALRTGLLVKIKK